MQKENVYNDEYLNNYIYFKLEKEKADSTEIKISDLVPIDWDSLIIIGGDFYPEIKNKEDIERVFKIKYDGPKKDRRDRSILFIKNNQIVKEIFSSNNYLNSDEQFISNFSSYDAPIVIREKANYFVYKNTNKSHYTYFLQLKKE